MISDILRPSIAIKVHDYTVDNGLWGNRQTPEHYLMLVISELNKAINAYQKENISNSRLGRYKKLSRGRFDSKLYERYIKGSFEEKLADAYIQFLDFVMGSEKKELLFGFHEVDEKKLCSLFANLDVEVGVFYIIKGVIENGELSPLSVCLFMECFALSRGIPLGVYALEKMRYKATRPTPRQTADTKSKLNTL